MVETDQFPPAPFFERLFALLILGFFAFLILERTVSTGLPVRVAMIFAAARSDPNSSASLTASSVMGSRG